MKTVYIIPSVEVMVCEPISALCASGDEPQPVQQNMQTEFGPNVYVY